MRGLCRLLFWWGTTQVAYAQADRPNVLFVAVEDLKDWAGDERYRRVTQRLRRVLPEREAEPILRKGAFRFDPETYTWQRKR